MSDGEGAFFRAPWSTTVKVVTVLATVVLFGASAVCFTRPELRRFPAVVASALPLAIFAVSALFMVRGYEILPGEVRVRRPLGWRVIPLAGLRRAWISPDAMAGSIRIFGDGGLFGFFGLFRDRRLGNYHAYATDPKRALVLELQDRKVVITPDDPARALEMIRDFHPEIPGPAATGGARRA